jgi:hypothetical protein
MTVAVCLKCGAIKHGAFTPCLECGHEPDDHEDLIKHLLVTDHYLSRQQIEAVSKHIREGKPVSFPPDLLQAAWDMREQLDKILRRGGRRKPVETAHDVPQVESAHDLPRGESDSEQQLNLKGKRSGRGCVIGLVVLLLPLGIALVASGIWRSSLG